MGEAQMELGEIEFEKIGEYVKSHLPQWISESGVDIGGETGEQRPPSSNSEEAFALRNRELDLIERVVRVEDELKNLREVMEERFGRMDERFSKMDERFEAQREVMEERFGRMDERFSKMDERFEAQRELMNERFDHVEKRFEEQQKQMDRHFDAMDKRFSFNQRFLGIGFTALALLIVVLNYLG